MRFSPDTFTDVDLDAEATPRLTGPVETFWSTIDVVMLAYYRNLRMLWVVH